MSHTQRHSPVATEPKKCETCSRILLGAACTRCDEKARIAAKAKSREQRRERARETAVVRGIALREEEAIDIEEAIRRSKQECQGLLALSEDDMIAVALARSRDDEQARQDKVQLEAALRWKNSVFRFMRLPKELIFVVDRASTTRGPTRSCCYETWVSRRYSQSQSIRTSTSLTRTLMAFRRPGVAAAYANSEVPIQVVLDRMLADEVDFADSSVWKADKGRHPAKQRRPLGRLFPLNLYRFAAARLHRLGRILSRRVAPTSDTSHSKTQWIKYIDPETRAPYWHNALLNLSAWADPVVDPAAQLFDAH